jgi:hypothetical protein
VKKLKESMDRCSAQCIIPKIMLKTALNKSTDCLKVTCIGKNLQFLGKKGIAEEVTKKRTRRTAKFQRAITGATLNDIMAKRNQKPEVRKAQREQAIRAAKEKNKAKEAAKKAQKVAQAKAHQKSQQKAAKVVQSKAPRVGGKR